MGVAVNLTVNRLPRDSENNFTMIPNSILRDSSLSLKAKGVLMYLIGERDNSNVPVNEKDTWTLTIKGLTTAFKESIGSIKRSLDELMQRGYLVRTDILNSRNLRIRSEYTVYEQPLDNTDGKPVRRYEDEQKHEEPKTEVSVDSASVAQDEKAEAAAPKGKKEVSAEAHAEACEAVIKEAIEFDKLSDDFGRDTAERVVGLLCRTINSKKNVSIGRQSIRPKDAAAVLLRLNFDDVSEVLDSVAAQGNIRKWDSYVLTSLYRAAQTSPNVAVGSRTIAIAELEGMMAAVRDNDLIRWWNEHFEQLLPFSRLAAHSYVYRRYRNDAAALDVACSALNSFEVF